VETHKGDAMTIFDRIKTADEDDLNSIEDDFRLCEQSGFVAEIQDAIDARREDLQYEKEIEETERSLTRDLMRIK
jgi:hypothetical protein